MINYRYICRENNEIMPFPRPNVVLIYDRSVGEFCDRSDEVEVVRREGQWAFVKFAKSPREYKYAAKNVIEKHSVEKSMMGYFAELATYIRDEEDDNEQSFLSKQVAKIKSTADSVLASYLNKSPIHTNTTPETLIYPFAVNTSQKEAIKKALAHNISIIQGPPGTGKTQSILNLIANLVSQSKSVGIVSNNNSAIENVKEKLVREGFEFLIAHLGNNDNKKRFFESSKQQFTPPAEWRLAERRVKSCRHKLAQLNTQIDRLLKAKEESAKCKELLPHLKLERELLHVTFEVDEIPNEFSKLQRWSVEKLLEFRTLLGYFPTKTPISKVFLAFSLSMRYGRAFGRARRVRDAGFCLALDALIYDKTIAKTASRIKELERVLAKNDIESLLKTCSTLSAELFHHTLYERYSQLPKEQTFTVDDYQLRFTEFTKRFPIILSTTHSILNSVPEPLDYIIIDESSQVDIITASLAFSACRNVVIVGDEQQLPHIVTDTVKEKAIELREQFQIQAEYDYVERNIITSLTALYGDGIPKTLLREHYRCNPMIIGFCNRKYYQGRLIVMKDEPAEGYDEANFPVRIFRTVEGLHGHNKINERQIFVIEHEVLPTFGDLKPAEIGIITPYRNQANLLKKTGIESDTIHMFQGREKRCIIFSTVSNEITEFMDRAELINVAVSRAIDQFVMVMPHSYELTHGSNIGDLIRYIEHWNPYGTVDSGIVSCFDLLQQADSRRLDDFKQRIKGVSRFESENIIEEVIRGILSENPAYSGFDIRRGYPLYLLTPDKTGLTEREIAYSNHRLSHVDFLIINRCDNSFVLAIEIDGYTYHTQIPQQERDAIKNKVLAINGIPLLRLSTRGDSETEKIRTALQIIAIDGNPLH